MVAMTATPRYFKCLACGTYQAITEGHRARRYCNRKCRMGAYRSRAGLVVRSKYSGEQQDGAQQGAMSSGSISLPVSKPQR